MGRVLAGSYRVFMFLEILKIKAKLWANISQSKKSKKDNTASPLFKILPADARHPPTHPLNSNLRLTLLSLTDFLFIVVYHALRASSCGQKRRRRRSNSAVACAGRACAVCLEFVVRIRVVEFFLGTNKPIASLSSK